MSDPVRVIVCGGRDYSDRAFVERVLDRFHAKWPIGLVIHGDATGADSFARSWAEKRGIQEARFPVTRETWRRVGAKAGPVRNRMMLGMNPDAVIAFPGGNGTADMIEAALQRGVRVERVGKHESETAPK